VQKIAPFLWFDTQAEEAAHFYASIFMLKMKKIDIAALEAAAQQP